ncbi:hypothetical protein ACMFMG_005095 [Clarireedia jacksonii]
MAIFVSSRFAGLHLQHLASRPTIQIVTHQNFSSCTCPRVLQSHSASISKALSAPHKPAVPKPIPQNAPLRRPRYFSSLPRGRSRRTKTQDSKKLPEYSETSHYRRPRRPIGNILLAFIIVGTCTYITLSWQESPIQAEITKLIPSAPKLKPSFLDQHFWLSQRNIDEGRYYTMFTNTLIHKDMTHLCFNMLATVSCISLFSPATFILLWAGAGISSSLFTLYAWKHHLPFGLNDKDPSSRFVERRAGGASGSLFGMFTALAIRNPRMSMMVFPIPVAIPAGVMLGGALVFSLLAMREGWLPGVGHTGHLGGAAFGFVWGVASLAVTRGRVRRF